MAEENQIRSRTNCACLAELAAELDALETKRCALKRAIAADPESVHASAKALWPSQLDAMTAYKKALKARIVNLVETDVD